MSDAFVFFGATGDLAYKQIFPSLQDLIRDEGFNVPIIGVAKANWTLDQLKVRAKDSLEEHGGLEQAAFEKMLSLLRYVDGDYADPATFTELRKQLGKSQAPLHYLAVPPSLFGTVAQGLQKAGCANNARVVVEKPFGHDLTTALELNRVLHKVFPEECIYRIDHYLGKEPVQNIIYTRFANPIFEPIWNRDHVRSIQITMAENFGVSDRGKFYDETGALRDVVQNHMLQVLANLTMDPPTGEDHEADRDSKAALLKAVRPLTPGEVVRGQYDGYKNVAGVAPGSTVETFIAIKLYIDSWRWSGVPIYIRAGKCLPITCMEAVVEFKRPPRETYHELVPLRSSHMRLRVSPDICIGLGVRVKVPGERMAGQDVELLLKRQTSHEMPPYQRLLGDAMKGDGSLFARQDLVEAQWRVVQPILDNVTPVYDYEPGSWGPDEAHQLIGADGPWIDPKPAQDETKYQAAGH
ncbi:MAG TPA: glucose-6-phosphate dehydrogenase [Bryocella sp.]|nr:glucose-6-phosphate dehydrogenase [Bryocella sp.]